MSKYLDEAVEITDTTDLNEICGWEETLFNKHLLVCHDKNGIKKPALLVLDNISDAIGDYVLGVGVIIDFYTKQPVAINTIFEEKYWRYCDGSDITDPNLPINEIISSGKYPLCEDTMSVGLDSGSKKQFIDLINYKDEAEPPLSSYPPEEILRVLELEKTLEPDNLPKHSHEFYYQYRMFRSGHGDKRDGSRQVWTPQLWYETGYTRQHGGGISNDDRHYKTQSFNLNGDKYWGYNYNLRENLPPPSKKVKIKTPHITVRKLIKYDNLRKDLPKY